MIKINKLACPHCKSKLYRDSDVLVCSNCRALFKIKDEIPIFIDNEEMKRWNKYHIQEYTPLFLNPNRRDFTYDVKKDVTNYLSAPFQTNDYYSTYVEDTESILDIGSGDGIFSAPLSNMAKEIFCLDPSFIALQRLKKRLKNNMYPICSKGNKLPFPDNSFDTILLIFVIEHSRSPYQILKEARRCLKQRGSLILSTDGKFWYRYFRPIIELLKYGHYRKDDPTHFNLMIPSEVRNLVKNAGFRIEEELMRYPFLAGVQKFIPAFVLEPLFSAIMILKLRKS